MGFPDGSVVKNLSANAQDAGDEASTLGSGRSRGEGNSKPTPDFLPGKIPWTEEPGRLQSMGSQRVRHDWEQRHYM